MRTLALLFALLLPATVFAGSLAYSHPDQYFFEQGVEAFQRDRHESSRDYFERAARFADKPSQLALAVMHEQGLGGARDLATAYAWADLAAERGYPAFLAERERLWAQLAPEQQARALEIGQALYAQYGDDVAKPRMEKRLRQGIATMTGGRAKARTSMPGQVDLTDPAAKAAFLSSSMGRATYEYGNLPSFQFPGFVIGAYAAGRSGKSNAFRRTPVYDKSNWDPVEYWKARDAEWGVTPVAQNAQ